MMGHKIGFVLKYFQSSKLLAINVFVAIIVLYHYHITFSSSSSPFVLFVRINDFNSAWCYKY